MAAAVCVTFTLRSSVSGSRMRGLEDEVSPPARPHADPRPVCDAHAARRSRCGPSCRRTGPRSRCSLYHGIGPESGFSNAADASYGVDVRRLRQADDGDPPCRLRDDRSADVHRLRRKKPADLPPRPLLLTFDDAGPTWTGGDAILKKLDFTAVLFVDVGRVDAGDREYLTWRGARERARQAGGGSCNCMFSAGKGHEQIQHGPGDERLRGRSTPTSIRARDFGAWQKAGAVRYRWGQHTSLDHDRGVRNRSPSLHRMAATARTAPTTRRIPDHLLGSVAGRYDAVFTQDVSACVRPGDGPPLGDFKVTRPRTTGGELHEQLQSGDT